MNIWCTHSDRSDVVDGMTMCWGCGQPIPESNLRRDLQRAIEIVYRDHGSYGRHSMRCIRTDEGWCCADDCEVVR